MLLTRSAKMSSELTEEYSNEEWWLDEGYTSQEDVPVPDWHLAILEERMARYELEDKTNWTTLEEFEKEIEQFMNSLKVRKD
jgi:hypothetical protein